MKSKDVKIHELQKKARTRKGRRELRDEFQDLLERQEEIRKRIDEYQFQITTLNSSYFLALADKEKNAATISVLEKQIADANKAIEDLYRHHNDNGETLELYSKIDLYSSQKKQGWISTLAAVIGSAGGVALGGMGLKMAYGADLSGELVNKKTYEWARMFPIFKGGPFKKG